MRRRNLLIIATGFLVVIGISANRLVAENKPESGTACINPDAFVYILNMGITCAYNPDYQEGTYHCLADGFAVGSGKYIVTAAHCLKDFEISPFRLFQPIVISPYYGELFEARIVAVDKTNDVAVLEAAWDAHPALELETGDKWKTGKDIKITGYPPVAAERGGNGLFSRKIMVEEVRLRDTNGRGACEVHVGPVRYAGKGWSGSPFINPETGKVVGLLTRKRAQKKWVFLKEDLIMGSSVDSIRNLLAKEQLQAGAVGSFASAPGAAERFDRILTALDAVVNLRDKQEEAMHTLCEELPSSCLAHLLAYWTEGLEGVSYLLKAIEMDPGSTLLRANYGRRLIMKEKFKDAAEQFQVVIDREPDHLFANYGLLVSLARADAEKAEVLGKSLTERWPENDIFWYEYSKILRAQEKSADQLAAIRKAVELNMDKPHQYRRQLADALAATGRLQESEQAFRILLETHECESCWGAYAALLSAMGPDKAALAEEATAKAAAFKKELTEENQTDDVVDEELQSAEEPADWTADEQSAADRQ